VVITADSAHTWTLEQAEAWMSGVHGTSVTGEDDRDEMGLCLEPARFVTGLARVPDGTPADHGSVAVDSLRRFEGEALLESGRALRELGREAEARARLQDALQVFEDMGEQDSAATVRAELLA
jgi:hypothetical protein